MIHLNLIKEEDEWTLLFVAQSGKRSQPLDLQKLIFPLVSRTKGLVLIAPVKNWVAAKVGLHYENKVRWMAFHEPDLKGAVVVLAQSRDRVVGEVLPLQLRCSICGTVLRSDAKSPYCSDHRSSNPVNQ